MGLMAANRIEKQSLPILIGWVLGSPQVIFFVLPNRMLDCAYSLSGNLGIPITAHLSELDGRGDLREIRGSWLALSRMIQFVVFGVAIVMIFFGEPFLRAWVGEEYAVKGRWVLRVLGSVLFLEGMASNAISLLVASGKHGKGAAVSLIVAILSIPLGCVLAWKMGVVGVAISVLLARAVVLLWVLLMALKVIQLPLGSHLRSTALRFVIPVATSCIILKFLQLKWSTPGYLAMTLQALLVGSVYAAMCWMMAFDQSERIRLLAGLRRVLGAVGQK
jgi:O-antigen/teichoic acid export membrane protein